MILIVVVLLLIVIYILVMSSNKDELKRKKYAVVIYGELRAINTVHENMNSYLINHLDADLYVVCQRTYGNEEEDLKKLNNLVYSNIYDRPENLSKYMDGKYASKDYTGYPGNWIDEERCTQAYINFNEISILIGDRLKENYDYIILTRSDYLFLINFPDLPDDDILWELDGHTFCGINCTLLCIPSKYVKDLLVSFLEYIENGKAVYILDSIIKDIPDGCPIRNIEIYALGISIDKGWNLGYIQYNAFITADSLDSRNTGTFPIKYDEEHKVHYKYDHQLNDSYKTLDEWNNGKRWQYDKDSKKLVLR
jgi:hypothetical protein